MLTDIRYSNTKKSDKPPNSSVDVKVIKTKFSRILHINIYTQMHNKQQSRVFTRTRTYTHTHTIKAAAPFS